MDSDLFQTIALVLLFLLLLVQLIQLVILNGVKRALGDQSPARAAIDETAPVAAGGYGATTATYGAATGGTATSGYEQAGYGGSGGYQAGTAAGYGGYSGAPAATTATPAPAETAATSAEARPEVATGYVPMEQATPAPQSHEPAAATTPAFTGNEPEEQPFERDGRWWFKRGGELLVYDEGTGQWVAAPGGYGGTAQSAAAGGGAATGGTETATYAPAADAGEGWRCASCGAINGSTATVCRMCFTPRA